MEEHRDTARLERWMAWVCPALIWASVLLVASVHPPVLLSLSPLFLLTALLSWRKDPIPLGTGFLLCLAAFCVLQSLPLPPWLVRWLSPSAYTVWSDAASLSPEIGWHSLSIEPEASRFEALKFTVYAAVWSLGQQTRKRRGLKHVASIVFGLGLCVALLTWLHTTAQLGAVYGVYEPRYSGAELIGPVLNPNNLAGLLNLAAFCGLAVALHRSTSTERAVVAALAAALLIAATFLTRSRGGSGCLVLGLCALVALLLKKQRHHKSSGGGRKASFVVGAAGAGAGLVLLAASPVLLRQLKDDSLSKLELWDWALDLIIDYPLFGTGRGGFGPAVTEVRNSAGSQVFTHAENWALEAWSGWGLLVGSAAVVGLCWALRPAPQLVSRSSSRMAMYGGVVVVALQNLADLALDVPGTSIAFLFVLGALNAQRLDRGISSGAALWWTTLASPGALTRRLQQALRALRPPERRFLGASLAIVVWNAVALPRLAHVERQELAGLVGQGGFMGATHEAVARHPGDAFLLRLGGAASLGEPDGRPLSWINVSLRRDPYQGRTYVLLADTLVRMGRISEALPSLRRAAELGPSLDDAIGERANRFATDDLGRVLPAGERGGELALAMARRAAEPAIAILALEAAADRGLSTGDVALLDAWLTAAERGQPPCENATLCVDVADRSLASLPEDAMPPEQRAYLQARLLALQGQASSAFQVLSDQCSAQPRCTALLLHLASGLDFERMRWAAERYLAAYCSSLTDCAQARLHVAGYFERRGEYIVALKHLEQAASALDTSKTWLRAARVAAQLQRRAKVFNHLKKAERAANRESHDAVQEVRRVRATLLPTTADFAAPR